MKPIESPTMVVLTPWTIRAWPRTTHDVYARLEEGSGPEECGCSYCRNWLLVRDRVCPPEYRQFVLSLGADWRLECEVVHYSRSEEGHLYGGWLHVVGELLDGPDANVPWAKAADTRSDEPDGYSARLEGLTASFELGITRKIALAPSAFAGLPLLQIEFSTAAPWVLPEPEPH